MTEPHADFIDDLAAHALGALDADDRARVEQHVATCAPCAAALDDYRVAAAALPVALEPVAPPADAWSAIATQARRRVQPPRRAIGRSVVGAVRRAAWPLVAAVAASLLVWNVSLERKLARYESGPQVEALARRPGRMVILRGTGAPAASARLFVAADGGHGHLAIAGLTPVAPGRTYQLWFVRRGQPTMSAAAFDVDAKGRGWVSVELPRTFDDVGAVIVTDEPAPGSAAPTGRHLLDARL